MQTLTAQFQRKRRVELVKSILRLQPMVTVKMVKEKSAKYQQALARQRQRDRKQQSLSLALP